jgi:hypothetical protein
MKKSLANTVAQDMLNVLESKDHQELFYKKASEEVDESNIPESFENIYNDLLETSAKLDDLGLEKTSGLLLKSLNKMMNEVAYKIAKEDSNDVSVKEVFDRSGFYDDVLETEPKELSLEIEELENDPDLKDADELLSNPEIVRLLDSQNANKKLNEKLDQYFADNNYVDDEDTYLDPEVSDKYKDAERELLEFLEERRDTPLPEITDDEIEHIIQDDELEDLTDNLRDTIPYHKTPTMPYHQSAFPVKDEELIFDADDMLPPKSEKFEDLEDTDTSYPELEDMIGDFTNKAKELENLDKDYEGYDAERYSSKFYIPENKKNEKTQDFLELLRELDEGSDKNKVDDLLADTGWLNDLSYADDEDFEDEE